MALGLASQVYFSMINEHWRHTGLLLPNLELKPVYHAYRAASELLSPTTYAGAIKGYPAGVEGYAFRGDSGAGCLDVIWSADGSTRSVDLPATAAVYDRYGAHVPVSGTLELDYSPMYVARP
jgi:hypothetical protein